MPDELITAALERLACGEDLTSAEARRVLERIMSGEVSEVQIAGFLIALRTKGETVDELVGLASAMRALATPVRCAREDLLDTAGTGGGRPSFNVSTTAALIAASAGCAVAKHGNRSATSLSGSADLLEALGARIDLPPEGVARCIEQLGFGFMFAPTHHAATRYVVPVRKELAVRTIFNLLGPLTNPAGARHQLIGVSDAAFTRTVAGAAAGLGAARALIVRSHDGLDELSAAAATDVIEVGDDGTLSEYTVSARQAGVEAIEPGALNGGGTPRQNAQTTRRIFAGESGPERETALLNAGAAIYAAGRTPSIALGVQLARAAVDDGRAAETLARFVELSNAL
ncbi:MAG: anthranilate phosphoribosyltransferase [Solirubrobacteraceae bacterium]